MPKSFEMFKLLFLDLDIKYELPIPNIVFVWSQYDGGNIKQRQQAIRINTLVTF